MIDEDREDGIAEAFRAFEANPSDQNKRDVLHVLENDDKAVRAAALRILSNYAEDSDYVEPLLSAVVSCATDPVPEVKDAVRTVLQRLAATCAEADRPLPGLSNLLTDDNTDVRRDALYAAKTAGERHPKVLGDYVEILGDRLSDPDAEIRHTAAIVLGYVADERSRDVADIAPVAIDRLENDDPLVKNAIVRALAPLSAHRPQAVVDAIPVLRSELDAGVVELEPTIEILANVADVAPESVRGLTGDLVDLAIEPADGVRQMGAATSREIAQENERRLTHETARANAVRTLKSIADNDPNAIAPEVEAVTPLLMSNVASIRERTLELLHTLGITSPRTMETSVPALLKHVAEAPTAEERTRAQEILIEFGDTAPSEFARSLEGRVDRLIDLLSHDDADIRGVAAGFLSCVAERNPEAVTASEEAVLQLLEDSDPVVQGNAALVLGLIGSDNAKAALTALDPDKPLVADTVEQALTRLE